MLSNISCFHFFAFLSVYAFLIRVFRLRLVSCFTIPPFASHVNILKSRGNLDVAEMHFDTFMNEPLYNFVLSQLSAIIEQKVLYPVQQEEFGHNQVFRFLFQKGSCFKISHTDWNCLYWGTLVNYSWILDVLEHCFFSPSFDYVYFLHSFIGKRFFCYPFSSNALEMYFSICTFFSSDLS